MLRQKGFDLGSVILFPVGNAAENDVGDPAANFTRSRYVITDTKDLDSSVELTVLGTDEKRVVSTGDILKFAELSKGSQEEVLHPKWPSGRMILGPSVQQAYWVALGQGALCTLANSLTNKVSDQCDILLKPSRGVRLKEDVKLGGLALLPEGKVMFYSADKASAALEAGAVALEMEMETGVGGSAGVVAVAPAVAMQTASPWWFVSTTKEASEANVEVVFFKVTNVAGVDPVQRIGIAPSMVSGLVTEDVRSTRVQVPVLVNLCALAAGTVLRRFVPSRKCAAKDPKAITVASVAKKAKLSGDKRSM